MTHLLRDTRQFTDISPTQGHIDRPPTWVPGKWLTGRRDAALWGTILFWEANKGYLTRMNNARAGFMPNVSASSAYLASEKQALADRRAEQAEKPALSQRDQTQ
jgi:hypothetical protein